MKVTMLGITIIGIPTESTMEWIRCERLAAYCVDFLIISLGVEYLEVRTVTNFGERCIDIVNLVLIIS
jgi:hypothetical protein